MIPVLVMQLYFSVLFYEVFQLLNRDVHFH